MSDAAWTEGVVPAGEASRAHHPKGKIDHALLRNELEHAAVQPALQIARIGDLEHHRVLNLQLRQLLEA